MKMEKSSNNLYKKISLIYMEHEITKIKITEDKIKKKSTFYNFKNYCIILLHSVDRIKFNFLQAKSYR